MPARVAIIGTHVFLAGEGERPGNARYRRAAARGQFMFGAGSPSAAPVSEPASAMIACSSATRQRESIQGATSWPRAIRACRRPCGEKHCHTGRRPAPIESRTGQFALPSPVVEQHLNLDMTKKIHKDLIVSPKLQAAFLSGLLRTCIGGRLPRQDGSSRSKA